MSRSCIALLMLACGPPLAAWAAADLPREGLLCWLDAADPDTLTLQGEEVTAWRNKAPGTSSALTADEGRRPLYELRPESGLRPVIRFDGYNDVLRDLGFGQQAARWTLAVLAAPHKGGGGLCSACPKDGHDYDPGFTVDLFQSGARFDQISVEGAGRIGGQKDQFRRDVGYGGLHLIVVERDDAEIRLFVDGLEEERRPVNPATTRMEALRVGARHYAGKECAFFQGGIAAMLLYGRILEAPERAALEQALSVTPEERANGERHLTERKKEAAANRMIAPKPVHTWPSIFAYETAQAGTPDFRPVAKLPVRDDLGEAIRLCVQHLNSLYDADRDKEPFFYANLRAEGTGEMHHSVNIGIPHVVGRCLVGCMSAELYAGVPFPNDGLAILERYLKGSFDNPNHLNSYYDPEQGNKRCIEFHNMREGLYGLWALAAGRDSAWARETAHQMLETLDQMTGTDGRWSAERAKALGMEGMCYGLATPNAARMVDPLLAYHRLSGDALALKLAGAYARAGLREMYEADGRFAPMERSSGHVHSITSALSGITDYAIFTRDAAMIEACRRIMDRGVPEYFSSWGWGDEVFPEHPANEVSRGEINQTGDVIRTALLLGQAGSPQYYELAERFLRGCLLPAQYQEDDVRRILRAVESPQDDSQRDVPARVVGGYSMMLPNDRQRAGVWPLTTQDIISGGVHALCECWRHRCTSTEDAVRVNLLFDCDGPEVTIRSDLPQKGRIRFLFKKAKPLMVRLPDWADAKTLKVTLCGESLHVEPANGYIRIVPGAAGEEGCVEFAVPCRIQRETVDGTEYTSMWIGNQPVQILPRGAISPLPF